MTTERNKKPPMDISRKEVGKEESKSGSLSYMSNKEPGENGKKRRFSIGKIDTKQVLMSSIIAIVLTAFMLFQLAPSKQALDSAKEELRVPILQTQENLTSAIQRLDNIVNTMGVYAKKSDLDSYVTKAQMDSIKVPIDSYVTKEASGKYVTWEGLPNYLSEGLLSGYALKSDLEDALSSYVIDKDITDGESPPSPELDPTLSKGVLVSFGGEPNGAFQSGSLTQTFILPTTITNNLGAGFGTAKDIELQLVLSSRGVPLGLTTCSIPTGWPFEWEVFHREEGTVVIVGKPFTGSSGLSVKQGKSIVFHVSFTLSVSSVLTVAVPLYAEGAVLDYN